MPEIVIAVLTYRRNDDLAELLPMLVQHASGIDGATSVLVVDNDPDGGAEPVVAAAVDDRRGGADDAPAVRYVHEAIPGIAAGRNRALEESRDARFLIFIDDDERPQDGWLEALLATARRTGAAAVVGPVESVFDVEPDAFVRAGNFFRRRRPPTGTRLEVAATNNLLLDLGVIERLGLRFDAEFGLSGGSDTLFTRQLAQSGAELVWCDEALVFDRVPATRVTRTWVLDRAFRSGNSWARTSLALAPAGWRRWRVRAELAAVGGLRVLAGLAQAAWGRLGGGLTASANGHRRLRRGAGMIAGLFGHVHVEYRRPASS